MRYIFLLLIIIKLTAVKSQTNQEEGLIDYYSKEIIAKPTNLDNYEQRGKIFLRQELFDKAIADFKYIIGKDDKYIEYTRIIGDIYLSLEKYHESIEYYNLYPKEESEDAEVYYKIGYAYDETKQYKKAIIDYSKSLQLKKQVKVYSNRGLVYSRLEQYEKALDDFNTAIDLDQNLIDLYYNRGVTYFRMKNYDAALLDLLHCEQNKNTNKYMYKYLMDIYMVKGNQQKICFYYKKVTELGLELDTIPKCN